MIEVDRCLSPSWGLSIRPRREVDRGDCGSDSDEEEELDIDKVIEGRCEDSPRAVDLQETGSGKEAVAVVVVVCELCMGGVRGFNRSSLSF